MPNDDKPLNPQAIAGAKKAVSHGLVNNPEQLSRKQAQEKEEADHTLRIVKALPDAFLYDYDGTETGTASHKDREGTSMFV